MIQTENFEINGHALVRTYSDAGLRIRKDGTDEVYDEAVDPVGSGRTYSETDEVIESEDVDAETVVERLEEIL